MRPTMSESDLTALKEQALGGKKAAEAWSRANGALHVFAEASGCPVGKDVADWFAQKRDDLNGALHDAVGDTIRQPRKPALAIINGGLGETRMLPVIGRIGGGDHPRPAA